MHRVVAPGRADRVDQVAVGTYEAARMRGVCARIGNAQASFALRGVFCGSPQPVPCPFAGDILPLGDFMLSVRERMPRVEVDDPFGLGLPGRIGYVGRPLGRGEGEVAPGIPVAVKPVGIVGVYFPRKRVVVAAPQNEVDRRAAHMVLRRRAVHHFGLLDPFDGCRAQQRCQLLGAHRRGLPVQDHRDTPGAGKHQPAVLFADARELGEGFVGIVHRLAFRYGFQVIGQPPLFDPHDGFFALYDHGVERIRIFMQDDLAGFVVLRHKRLHLIGEVLEQQPVGAYLRCDGETPVGIRCRGREVGRVGVEHHYRDPDHGLPLPAQFARRSVSRKKAPGRIRVKEMSVS